MTRFAKQCGSFNWPLEKKKRRGKKKEEKCSLQPLWNPWPPVAARILERSRIHTELAMTVSQGEETRRGEDGSVGHTFLPGNPTQVPTEIGSPPRSLVCRVYLATLPYSHRTDSSKPEDVKKRTCNHDRASRWVQDAVCGSQPQTAGGVLPRNGLGRSYLSDTWGAVAGETHIYPWIGTNTFWLPV